MTNGITDYLCAVDGGGTGCRAAIARADGTVLVRAAGGPANYTTNPAQAAQSVRDAVSAAVGQLGAEIDLKTLVAHVGIAGILDAQDCADFAARLPFATCSVSDDRVTSALGVLGDRDGAVLAIGTGSFVAARHGTDMRFWGGWGLAVGDQASGAWLGRAVLDHSLRAADGLAAHSDLSRAILARFGNSQGAIALFAARAKPSEFADLAPMIVAAAKAGDALGHALMLSGADYLNAVLECAKIADHDAICLTGGVGPHYQVFLAPTFRARIRAPQGVALDGALALARKKWRETEALA